MNLIWYQIKAESLFVTVIPKAESLFVTVIPKTNFTQNFTCSLFCGSASYILYIHIKGYINFTGKFMHRSSVQNSSFRHENPFFSDSKLAFPERDHFHPLSENAASCTAILPINIWPI